MATLKHEEIALSDVEPGMAVELTKSTKAYQDYYSPKTVCATGLVYVRGSGYLHLRDPETNKDHERPYYMANTAKLHRLIGKTGRGWEQNYAAWLETNLENCGVSKAVSSVGSDPEVFIVDKKDRMIPAFEFLPAKSKTTTVFWDGFQAEFTTGPNACLAYHVDNVQKQLKLLLRHARTYNNSAKISIKDVLEVPKEVLASAPDKCVEFGCTPSKNAYGIPPVVVGNPREVPFRMAGCHLHFALGANTTNAKLVTYVKGLDCILGIATVSLFAGLEDPRRRELYGKAGEYRIPSYGLEYRVPGAALLGSPTSYHLAGDLGRAAIACAAALPKQFLAGNEEKVQDIINMLDVKAARKWIKEHSGLFHRALRVYYPVNTAASAMKALLNGIEVLVADPTDVVKNWKLDGQWATHSEGTHVAQAKVR